MGKLRDRMAEDLKLAGYSPTTRRVYLLYAKNFVKHYRRAPTELGEHEIRTYLLHLLDRGRSYASYRQAYAALKFLYSVTLHRPFDVESIPRYRTPKAKLPIVLSGLEVLQLLDAFDNLRYRTIVTVIYAAGLRLSEATALQVDDIDSKRMLLRIRNGKGGKERYVMLSQKLLLALRAYWLESRPKTLLFPGRSARTPINPTSVRKAMQKACIQAGVRKRVTPHILRHCFATHLLEMGVSIRVVQVLLGHHDIHVTSRYLKVSTKLLQGLKSPYDLLGTPEAERLG